MLLYSCLYQLIQIVTRLQIKIVINKMRFIFL